MTKETSVEAYRIITEYGLLSSLRMEVYKIIFNHGPLSAQEAWHLAKEDPKSLIKNRRDGITQRFSELERLGVIKNSGKGICSVSGRMVIKWVVTGHRPLKLDKATRYKCATCKGKGYIEEIQTSLL
jgi:hypothetical protein